MHNSDNSDARQRLQNRCCWNARGGASAGCEPAGVRDRTSAFFGDARALSLVVRLSSAYTARYGDRVVRRSPRPRQYCTCVLVAAVGTPAGDSGTRHRLADAVCVRELAERGRSAGRKIGRCVCSLNNALFACSGFTTSQYIYIYIY